MRAYGGRFSTTRHLLNSDKAGKFQWFCLGPRLHFVLAVVAATLTFCYSANAQTTITNGQTVTTNDPVNYFSSAGSITMYNGSTLQIYPSTQNASNAGQPTAGYQINNALDFAGTAGTINLQFSSNDTYYNFNGGLTSTATGAQTLAIFTGSYTGGDREAINFFSPITDGVGVSSTLGINVLFQNNASGDTSYVNLPAINTFSGPINLNSSGGQQGELVIGGEAYKRGFDGHSPYNFIGTGTLGNGNYAGAISLASNTTLNYDSTSSQVLSGQISGNGSLILSGLGSLTLSGNYGYNGSTTVNSGALVLNMNGGGSLASGNALTLNPGTTLALIGQDGTASSQTFSNVTFNKFASPTDQNGKSYTQGGASTFSVTGGASGGTMNLTIPGGWSSGLGLTYNVVLGVGGTLTSSPTTDSSGPTSLVVDGGNNAYATVTSGGRTDWAKVVSGNVVGFTDSDYIALPVDGSASSIVNYLQTDGATASGSIYANTLKIVTTQASQSLNLGGNTMTLTEGGLLFTGSNDYHITSGQIQGSAGSEPELLVHQFGTGNLSIDAQIIDNGNPSALVKSGPGTLTLTNANNSFTGGTYLTAGVLNINEAGALGNNSSKGEGQYVSGGIIISGGTISNTSGSSIDLSGYNNNLFLSGSFTFAGASDGSKNLYFGNLSQSNVAEAVLLSNTIVNVSAGTINLGTHLNDNGNNYSLTKNGPGTLELGNNNNNQDFTGGLYINQGTFAGNGQDGAPDFGASPTNGNAGGMVYLGDPTPGGTKNATLDFEVPRNNGDHEVASNNLTVRAGSSGELAFITDNTSSGAGNGVNGLSGTILLNNSLTVASLDATQTNLLSGSISGTGGLRIGSGTYLNSGIVMLSGVNTYTGTTSLGSGVLNLGSQTALQDSTLVMSGGSLVFDSSVSGNAYTLGGLSAPSLGAGYDIALQNNAGTPAAIALSVGGNNANTTYAGVLSGLGGLTKVGTGTLTLSASSTYSGNTSVSSGTLQILAGGSIGSSPAIAVSSGATLDVSAVNPFVLHSGQTLAANGTVYGGLTISSSADLNGVGALTANAPGKSVTVSGIIGPGTYGGAATTEGVGTLTIGTSAQNENLSLGATSIYNWGVSASGQGLISVAGNVSIASGAEVLVHNAGQGSPATSYTILTWTGSGPSIVPTTVAYAAPPSGTTVNWTGGGSPSSAWSTATNWDLGSYTGGVLTKTSSSLILSGLTVVPTTPVSTSAVVIAPVGGVAVTGPSTATTVNSLTIGNGTDATSLAVQSSGPFTVTNALTLNNNATLAGPGTVNAASLNFLSGSASLSGGVSVSALAVTVNGTANFGSSTITTGTMAVNGTANLNAGSTLAITSLSGSGAVNFNGGAVQAASNLTLSGGPNTVVQSGGAVFNTNGNTITLSQALTHGSASAVDGGLTVQGGGNLVVNTAQSYTGPTVISGGILQLSGLVVTPGLNVEFVGGNDTTAISQQSTFNAWLPTQQLYLQTTTIANSSAHARINYPDVGNSFSDLGFNSSNSSIPSGVDLQNNFTISMTGDLTITNGGSYNFGTNSDDGSMVWIDGNLVVNNNNYQGMGGNRSDPATVQQQGSIYLTAGVHTIQIGYYQGGGGYGLNVSYSGADTLTDTGSPETNDNGWVFLPNSVLSVITQRATANILPVTSALTVATTATLDLNGDSQQLASLAGGGTITNSNSGSPVVLTLSNTGSTTTFSGSIIDGAAPGGVSLVISGSGTQVLSGSNTYSGGTTVQSGTLILDGASSLLAGSSLVIGSAPSGGGIILPNSVSSPRSSPTLAPVPEPGTMALLCVGALMVLGYRLRRRLGD